LFFYRFHAFLFVAFLLLTHSFENRLIFLFFLLVLLFLCPALLSLQALLSCPNPDDPQDAQVAGQYKKDHALYVKTAKFWTDTYAQKPKKDNGAEEKIKKVTEQE